MRIDPTQSAKIQATTPRPVTATPSDSNAAPAIKPDSVKLSPGTEQLRRAQTAAASSPDVRADRIAAIKAQVQNGTYQVDNKAVAEKLLDVL